MFAPHALLDRVLTDGAGAALPIRVGLIGFCPPQILNWDRHHLEGRVGVRGIVDEADVHAGKIQIIAPRDFMQHTISENVYAGNAMNRRLFYQYGILLPASPFGHAGQGLAQTYPAAT